MSRRVRQQLLTSLIEKAEAVHRTPQLKFFIPSVSTDDLNGVRSRKRRRTEASPFERLVAELQPSSGPPGGNSELPRIIADLKTSMDVLPTAMASPERSTSRKKRKLAAVSSSGTDQGFEVLRAINSAEQRQRRARRHFQHIDRPPQRMLSQTVPEPTLEETSQLASGCILLAHPSVTDSLWSSTVVYLTNHSATEGTLGYILNRPLPNPRQFEKDAANDLARMCSIGLAEARQKAGVSSHLLSSYFNNYQFHLGGPVCEADGGPSQMHFAQQTLVPAAGVSPSKRRPGASLHKRIGEGKEAAPPFSEIELLAPHIEPHHADSGRLFLGCCFWVPDQLEKEIERKEWLLIKPKQSRDDAVLRFGADSPSALDLYFYCLSQLGGDFSALYRSLNNPQPSNKTTDAEPSSAPSASVVSLASDNATTMESSSKHRRH